MTGRPTNAFDFALPLSQDPTLIDRLNSNPSDDRILTQQPAIVGVNNSSFLNVGDSYSSTVNVPLPVNAQGTSAPVSAKY